MSIQQHTSTSKIESFIDGTRSFSKKLVGNRNAVIGLIILIPLITMSLLSPVLVPEDPTETSVEDRFEGPSADNPFGTDNQGRDLLSRVMVGGQSTLYLGIASVLLALLLGVPIGLVSGYAGGVVDEALMRFMDMLMAIPALLLALILVSMISPSINNAIIAIGVVYAPRIARIVRGGTLSEKNEEYVLAAESRGESNSYIMFSEILPNIVSPIVVESSIRIGFAIIVGTSLSFLGLGAQPPQADWGYMIAQSRSYIFNNPWFLIWPSLFLSLTVLGFNLLGDGLRDVLDPKIQSDNI